MANQSVQFFKGTMLSAQCQKSSLKQTGSIKKSSKTIKNAETKIENFELESILSAIEKDEKATTTQLIAIKTGVLKTLNPRLCP